MTRRLRIRLTLLVAFVALQAASSAGAQNTYSCKDHNGRTLTSDRPIPDCVGVMRELGPSGVVRREIAPPLTAEQQRQKEADERARRAAEEVAREQHRRDMALLTAYQNEDQIEAARKRSLSDANDSIKASHERLADLEKEKSALAHDAEAYKGKTVPPLFKRKVDDNQALIDDEEAAIKQRQVDVERVNQRYDEEKRRFRELNAAKK
jgi:hypothetical protein